MAYGKTTQDLRRDLQGMASDLKWSAVELNQIAARLSAAGNQADAEALKKMTDVFHRDEERLATLADEIANGGIARIEIEHPGAVGL